MGAATAWGDRVESLGGNWACPKGDDLQAAFDVLRPEGGRDVRLGHRAAGRRIRLVAAKRPAETAARHRVLPWRGARLAACFT